MQQGIDLLFLPPLLFRIAVNPPVLQTRNPRVLKTKVASTVVKAGAAVAIQLSQASNTP